jgi:L-amino acid N-acyltransferase YncA
MGWASLSWWSPKKGDSKTAEVPVCFAPRDNGKGVGTTKESGFKFSSYVDVGLLQLLIDSD